VIDQLRNQGKGGQASTARNKHDRWAPDAQCLDWDPAKLAEEWGISERAAKDRLRLVVARQPDASEV